MSTTLSIRPTPTQCSTKSLSMAVLEEDPRSPQQTPPLSRPLSWPLSQQVSPSQRQITERISAIAQTTLSPESCNRHLLSLAAPTDPLNPLLADPVTEAALAIQYTQTCLSLWQLAQEVESTRDSPGEDLPQSFPRPLPRPLPKVSCAQQQFTQQLAQLCRLWAIGKWQQPTHPFFAQHPTAFTSLQAKWKNPAIQAALRNATTHLLQNPQERWITAHTDCWAYLLGQVMHQLLQWNYQLTPSLLRGIITKR